MIPSINRYLGSSLQVARQPPWVFPISGRWTGGGARGSARWIHILIPFSAVSNMPPNVEKAPGPFVPHHHGRVGLRTGRLHTTYIVVVLLSYARSMYVVSIHLPSPCLGDPIPGSSALSVHCALVAQAGGGRVNSKHGLA